MLRYPSREHFNCVLVMYVNKYSICPAYFRHFGAPNLHDEDQKEPSLKELTNSQNIDVTKPRSKETPFVSAEVRGSSAKGASLEHFLPQGDNLKALGMCGWTRQFTSYVSPGGGSFFFFAACRARGNLNTTNPSFQDSHRHI